MASKKIYIVKQEWNHFSLPTRLKFIRGTAAQIAEYYGNSGWGKEPTIRTVLSRVRKSYEHREACCYGRTSVDLVEVVPEGGSVQDLAEREAEREALLTRLVAGEISDVTEAFAESDAGKAFVASQAASA